MGLISEREWVDEDDCCEVCGRARIHGAALGRIIGVDCCQGLGGRQNVHTMSCLHDEPGVTICCCWLDIEAARNASPPEDGGS